MREEAGTLKGEIVIAVEGRASGGSGATEERAGLPGSGLDEVLLRRLEAGESVASAARASASELHLPRRIVYRRALDLHAERKRPR